MAALPRRKLRRPGHLQHQGVQPRTQALYLRALAQFFQWLRLCGTDVPTTGAALDRCAADHLNHLYQEGEALTAGGIS